MRTRRQWFQAEKQQDDFNFILKTLAWLCCNDHKVQQKTVQVTFRYITGWFDNDSAVVSIYHLLCFLLFRFFFKYEVNDQDAFLKLSLVMDKVQHTLISSPKRKPSTVWAILISSG